MTTSGGHLESEDSPRLPADVAEVRHRSRAHSAGVLGYLVRQRGQRAAG